MVWYIIAAFAAFIAIVLLAFTYLRDRRYEKKGALEAMGPELRKEIEQEKEDAQKRRERFEAALGAAMGVREDEETDRTDDIS